MDITGWEFAYVPTTGGRRAHDTPVVLASDAALEGYGCLVDDPKSFPIEIVRWPAQGWRSIDSNSGDQGGVTEGLFEFCWKGETLYASISSRSSAAISHRRCSAPALEHLETQQDLPHRRRALRDGGREQVDGEYDQQYHPM